LTQHWLEHGEYMR